MGCGDGGAALFRLLYASQVFLDPRRAVFQRDEVGMESLDGVRFMPDKCQYYVQRELLLDANTGGIIEKYIHGFMDRAARGVLDGNDALYAGGPRHEGTDILNAKKGDEVGFASKAFACNEVGIRPEGAEEGYGLLFHLSFELPLAAIL